MRRIAVLPLVISSVSLVSACAHHRGESLPSATAELADSAGHSVGMAVITEERNGGVRLIVHVSGMTPGNHGIHFHAVGSCVPPAFTSAGGHFNPGASHHGLNNAAGPHAGDLPNLVVGADGKGSLDARTSRVTLAAGTKSLFDSDGTALVIHAGPDDQTTDPSGNSGARIACGIVRSATP